MPENVKTEARTEATSCFRNFRGSTEAESLSKERVIAASAECSRRRPKGGDTRREYPPGVSLPPASAHPLPPAVGSRAPQPPERGGGGEKVVEWFHEFTPPTATAQTRRHTGRVTYLPAGTKRAAALLRAVFEQYAPTEKMSGPIEVSLLWTWHGKGPAPKTTRPDLDNLSKIALDSATKAGYWYDDAQVAVLHTAKFTGPMPGLAFTARAIMEGGR